MDTRDIDETELNHFTLSRKAPRSPKVRNCKLNDIK